MPFDPYETEIKNENGNFQIDGVIVPGRVRVSSGGGLFIDVAGFGYELNGTKGTYAGVTGQAVPPSATTDIYLDSAGTLQLGTFPANTATHVKLAQVTTNGSAITNLVDSREFFASQATTLNTPETLDSAYDGSGSGAGRIITADNGPVEIAGATTQAPFRIVPTGTTPNASLANGQIFQFSLAGGKPCLASYDSTRAKWLSNCIFPVTFALDGAADGQIMSIGVQTGFTTGYRMLYNGTIVGITSKSAGGVATKNFVVFSNDNFGTPLITFSETANAFLSNTTNVDFNAGDYLQCGVNIPLGTVTDPVVTLWIAWRF